MKQAQLPDGQLIEFPDDATPEEMTSALNEQFPIENPPPEEPRDTTTGEKIAGGLLGLAGGAQIAAKSVTDLGSLIFDNPITRPIADLVTKPASEGFQRGFEATEALKPEAFKAKQPEGFLDIDAEGAITGAQLPSIENTINLVTQTLPLIPFFISGGLSSGKALQAATSLSKLAANSIGFGATNAALIAPGQAQDTRREVLDAGGTEQEAAEAALTSGALTAFLTFATGAAGGAIASRLGAGSGSLASALAKGFIAEGPFEGLEEGGQSIIADVAAGRNPDLVSALDQTLSALAIGGTPGSVIAGIEQRSTSRQSAPEIPALTPEQQAVENELRAKIGEAEATIAGTAPIAQATAALAPEVAPEVAPVEVQPKRDAVKEISIGPGVKLFHGTTAENIQKIQETGIIEGPAFFTPRKGVAEEFAGSVENVIEIEIPKEFLKIDLDLPGGRLLNIEDAADFLGRTDELASIDDFINGGFSVGVEANVNISSEVASTEVQPPRTHEESRTEPVIPPAPVIEPEIPSRVTEEIPIEEADFQFALEQAQQEAQAEAEGTSQENVDAMLAGFNEDPGMTNEEAERLADSRFEREVANVDEGTAPENVSQGSGVAPKTSGKPAPEPQPREQAERQTEGRADDQLEPGDEGFTTSLKNQTIEEERAARGDDPLISDERKTNPETVAEAEKVLKENPDRADEIVDEILTGAEDTINDVDSAILLLAKVELMNERGRQADRASNEKLSEDNRLTAQGKWREAEVQIEQIEQAARAAGTQAGRNLQIRKLLIRNDFSIAAMESKARAVRMRALTPEEVSTIKAQSEQIAALTKKSVELQQEVQDLKDKAQSERTFDSLAKKFADRKKPKSNREWLIDLNKKADVSRAWLKAQRVQTNVGIDPTAYFHLVRIGAAHFANGAVKLADWIAAMKADIGERIFGDIEPQLETMFDESKQQVEADAVESGARLADDIILDARSDAAAGLDMTHRTVYELARAHILQGVSGENAVMSAVHSDLEPLFPGLTEREVRRAFSQYGEVKFPSKALDKVELREIKVLVRLQESIDRLNQRLAPLRTGLQRDKATKKIRDKQRQLNALMKEREARDPSTSPDRLASVNEARQTRLKNQIVDLDEQIRTGKKPVKGEPVAPTPEVVKLTKFRDALKDKLRQIEEAKNPPPNAEERYNITRGKQLRRQLKEVQARLRAGDYARRVRPTPPKLNKENEKLAFDLHKAKADFITEQYKFELDQASKVRKTFRFIGRLLSFSRSVKTSFDLSATLRQAGIPLLAHPRGFALDTFSAQLKAIKNDAAAHALNEQILNHPKTPFALKAGLFLNRQDAAKPSEREEIYMDEWVKKTPGVAASSRAYTVGLNTIRITYFNHLVETLGRSGQVTAAEAKHIAYWVNRATGRGNLRNFSDTGVSTIFFAPRWVQSRFSVLSGLFNPTGLIFGAPSKRLKIRIAKEYARSSAGFIALTAMIGSAFALAADDDEDVSFSLDMKSTDFLKLKVDDTRVDLTAAMSSPVVFLTRVLGGKKTTQSGKVVSLTEDVPYGGDNTWTIITRFLRSKLAPPLAAGINAKMGENVVGEPTTLGNEAVQLFVPLALADMVDVMEAQGVPKGTALTAISILGGATNTYAERQTENEKARRPRSRIQRERRRRR